MTTPPTTSKTLTSDKPETTNAAPRALKIRTGVKAGPRYYPWEF